MEEQPHHTGLDSSTGALHALSCLASLFVQAEVPSGNRRPWSADTVESSGAAPRRPRTSANRMRFELSPSVPRSKESIDATNPAFPSTTHDLDRLPGENQQARSSQAHSIVKKHDPYIVAQRQGQ